MSIYIYFFQLTWAGLAREDFIWSTDKVRAENPCILKQKSTEMQKLPMATTFGNMCGNFGENDRRTEVKVGEPAITVQHKLKTRLQLQYAVTYG